MPAKFEMTMALTYRGIELVARELRARIITVINSEGSTTGMDVSVLAGDGRSLAAVADTLAATKDGAVIFTVNFEDDESVRPDRPRPDGCRTRCRREPWEDETLKSESKTPS